MISLANMEPLMQLEDNGRAVTVNAGVRYGELGIFLHETRDGNDQRQRKETIFLDFIPSKILCH